MKTTRLMFVLFIFILTGFFSCSKAEPRILYGFIELIYYQVRGNPEERYSFFILPEDDDGVENLDELYLYHDREGLRWFFTSDDWIKHEEDGKTWIGSRNIAMHDNIPLPRGQYRAVLVNKGGESTERKFTYDGPDTSPYPSPSISIGEGYYHINSQYPVNQLICYDQQGKIIQTLPVKEKEGSIGDLRFQGAVRTVALWAEDPEYRISVLTDVATIR
jgi:hypothetical protein